MNKNKEIAVKAYAKINWALDVLYKRADGYHELDTLMQAVDLSDSVHVRTLPGGEIRLKSSAKRLPCDERNTAYRAADLYFKSAGREAGCEIFIEKRIPSQAGLGGGSADAAAVLRALQRIYGYLGEQELYDIALKVGADVPFCLHGGLARCRGVGEKIEPLDAHEYSLLLVMPGEGVSTRELFRSLNLSENTHSRPSIDIDGIKDALLTSDAQALAGKLETANALTSAAIERSKRIGNLLKSLQRHALSASMTGSGSCCFGLFPDLKSAQAAAEHFSEYPFVRVARTLGHA